MSGAGIRKSKYLRRPFAFLILPVTPLLFSCIYRTTLADKVFAGAGSTGGEAPEQR